VYAHRYGKRFVVHANEKLTAFLELESAICACGFWQKEMRFWDLFGTAPQKD